MRRGVQPRLRSRHSMQGERRIHAQRGIEVFRLRSLQGRLRPLYVDLFGALGAVASTRTRSARISR